MLLQRKNDSREANSTSLTAYALPAAIVGIAFDPKHKLRTCQNPLERCFDSGLESAGFASFLEERHRPLNVFIRHRSPIGSARQIGYDLPGASRLVARIRRTACENSPAARRVAGADRVEWTCDGECLNVRLAGPVEIVDGAANVSLQPLRSQSLRVIDECDGHVVRSRFDGHSNAETRIHCITGVGRLLE
jgi:hypothetical protein